jgi:hypothetical protein
MVDRHEEPPKKRCDHQARKARLRAEFKSLSTAT